MSLLHSIKWNYIGSIFKGFAQLFVMAILARLLEPAEFGLMALALVAIKFGRFFSDFGLAAAVQQKKDLQNSDIQASFWFSSISGLVFFVVTFLFADIISEFYNNNELSSVIKGIGMGFFVIGVSTTSIGLLKRKMEFKYLSILDTLSYFIAYGAIGVFLAYKGFGVFSLVVAYLSHLSFMAIASYAKTKHTLYPPKRLIDYKNIVNYGAGYSVGSFLSFIGSNVDQLILAKFFPIATLGVWSRARNLVTMPSYTLLVSITNVLLPAYSKYQDDPKTLEKLYRKSLLFIGCLLVPIGGAAFVSANELVDVLLGEKWSVAVPFVKFAAVFVPFELLSSVAATLCSALGYLRLQIKVQIFLLIFLIPLVIIFSIQQSIESVLIVLAFYYWLRFFIYILIIKNKQGFKQWDIIQTHFLACFWVSTLVYLATFLFASLNSFIILPIQIAAGGLGLISFLFLGPSGELKVMVLNLMPKRKAVD